MKPNCWTFGLLVMLCLTVLPLAFAAPQIVLTPSSGAPGTAVNITGTGFTVTNPLTCNVSYSNLPVSESTPCSLYSNGAMSAGFIVAGSASVGQYLIVVEGSSGDYAYAYFTVGSTESATLTLNPSSGSAGSTVSISGFNYKPVDTSCYISGGMALTPQFCSISNGDLTGAFIVGNGNTGYYTITVNGSPAGDSASAEYYLTQSSNSASISLNPSSAIPGQTVIVSGFGFLTSDTSCQINGEPVYSMTCEITNGDLYGSFQIPTYLGTGGYTITATGSGGDSAQTELIVNTSTSTTTASTITSIVTSTLSVVTSTTTSTATTTSYSTVTTTTTTQAQDTTDNGTVILYIAVFAVAALLGGIGIGYLIKHSSISKPPSFSNSTQNI